MFSFFKKQPSLYEATKAKIDALPDGAVKNNAREIADHWIYSYDSFDNIVIRIAEQLVARGILLAPGDE